jgi:hypothetical protein
MLMSTDYHRWNFETNDDSISVCRDLHEKGCPCEYETLTPNQTLEIINDLRSQVFKSKTEAVLDASFDLEFMKWIYERMVYIHNEHINMDYMIKFKKMLQKLDVLLKGGCNGH